MVSGLVALFALGACKSGPPADDGGGNQPNTSLPLTADPCEAADGSQKLAFKSFLEEVTGAENWLEGLSIQYDATTETLYVAGGSFGAYFVVYRMDMKSSWSQIYERIVGSAPKPNGHPPFLDFSSAYDPVNEDYYLSLVEAPRRLDGKGGAAALGFPSHLEPSQWLAFDVQSGTLFVAHPEGIHSLQVDGTNWKSEADMTDLQGAILTGLFTYRSGEGVLILCASAEDGAYCREGSGTWKKVPALEAGLEAVAIRQLSYDVNADRLYARTESTVLASDGLSGWTTWLDTFAAELTAMQADPGLGLYVLTGDRVMLFHTPTLWERLVSVPITVFGAHGLIVIPGAERGFAFVNYDGCPSDDAECRGSEVYNLCLE